MPKVTTIILTHDQAARTLHAVRAVLPDLAALDGDLVLVDQASSDGVAKQVEECVAGRVPLRVVHNPTNQSFATAANLAARDAIGDFLLFLDNDTQICPGALATLVASCEADERAAAVGPKLVYPTGQIEQAGLALPLWLVPFPIGGNARGDDHRFNFPRQAFAVATSCMLVRRPAFEAVNGFEERYIWGFEAADLALSFRKRAWKVLYEPRAVCVHEGGASLSLDPALSATDENRKILLERWGVKLLGQVAQYLDRLAEDGPRRFVIFGTGESGQHLAHTLEIGGYEVTGFLSGNGIRNVGAYPAWNVNDIPEPGRGRVLIGSPYVRDAEEVLAGAGLLAGAALPILLE